MKALCQGAYLLSIYFIHIHSDDFHRQPRNNVLSNIMFYYFIDTYGIFIFCDCQRNIDLTNVYIMLLRFLSNMNNSGFWRSTNVFGTVAITRKRKKGSVVKSEHFWVAKSVRTHFLALPPTNSMPLLILLNEP